MKCKVKKNKKLHDFGRVISRIPSQAILMDISWCLWQYSCKLLLKIYFHEYQTKNWHIWFDTLLRKIAKKKETTTNKKKLKTKPYLLNAMWDKWRNVCNISVFYQFSIFILIFLVCLLEKQNNTKNECKFIVLAKFNTAKNWLMPDR